MPSVTIRQNGAVVGFGPRGRPPGTGGLRSTVKGWSEGSARRLLHKLFEVDGDSLPDTGLSLTVTFDRDLSFDEFHLARSRYVDTLRRRSDLVTWVVEWTAAGRPHLHLAVYGFPGSEVDALLLWFVIVRPLGFDPVWRAQHGERIYGAVGWLAYLAKHAGRGVAHYQRQGSPVGWDKTGRLWGFNGAWPSVEPLRADVSPSFARDYRALLEAYATARRGRLGILPPELGVEHAHEYRGLSLWIPLEEAMLLLVPLIEGA